MAFLHKYPINLLIFAVIVVLIPLDPSISQNLPVDSHATVREEQDYAFAAGLFKEKQFPLSIRELNKFIDTYPRSLRLSDAYLLLAESHYAIGEYAKSIEKFKTFIEYYPHSKFVPSALLKMGLAYVRSSDRNNARETLRKVLEKYPEDPVSGEAAYWLGDISLSEENLDNAIKYFALAYETSEVTSIREYALYSLAWSHQRKKNYALAILLYDSTLATFPAGILRGQVSVRRAECLFYDGRYAEAILWLTPTLDTISSVKERMDVLYLLAESYFYAGEYKRALPLYRDLLNRAPSPSMAREATYALAWSHFNLAHYDSSAALFHEIGKGNDAIAHQARYRYAVSLQRLGKAQNALVAFENIYSQEKEGEYIDNAMYGAALIYLDHLRDRNGEILLRDLIERYPSSDILPDALFALGQQLYKRTQSDSSASFLREAIFRSSPPTELHRSSLLLYAQASLNMGENDSAFATLQRLVKEYPGSAEASMGIYWLAETEYRRGNYSAAISLFSRVLETDPPKREEALRGVAWSHYKQGEYLEAMESFQRLIEEYPRGRYLAESRLRLGDVLFASRDFKKAAGQYLSFIRLHRTSPDIVYAQYQLAQSRYRAGEFQQAIQEFNELIRRYPGSDLADDAQYGVGWVWFQTKDYNQAIIAFQRIIRNYPKSDLVPRAYYSIGDSYYNNRQFEAAAKSYMEVVYQFPEDPLAMDAVSGAQFSYIAAGKENEALLAVDRYLTRNPATPVKEPLLLKQGELLVTLRRYPEADRHYREFIDNYPHSTFAMDAKMALGSVLEQMDRPGDAAEIYRTVSEKRGKNASQALLRYGRIQFNTGLLNEARAAFTSLLESYPNDESTEEARYLLGMVNRRERMKEAARGHFEKLIHTNTLSPFAARAKIRLAELSGEEGNHAEALNLALSVARSRNDEIAAEAQYFAGEQYLALQDPQNALTAFLRVRILFPTQERWVAKSQVGVGKSYLALGDITKARESYSQAMRFKNFPDVVSEAEKALNDLR